MPKAVGIRREATAIVTNRRPSVRTVAGGYQSGGLSPDDSCWHAGNITDFPFGNLRFPPLRQLNQPRAPFALRPKHFRGIAHIVPRSYARGSKWRAYPTTINAQQKVSAVPDPNVGNDGKHRPISCRHEGLPLQDCINATSTPKG